MLLVNLFEYNYYFYMPDCTRKYIKKELYNEAWIYYNEQKKIKEAKLAYVDMIHKYGGKPCKRVVRICGNAILQELYDKLADSSEDYANYIKNNNLFDKYIVK